MKFDHIKLKNYRQYKDALIEFPPFDRKKSFIIIIGGTGTGKTNLLNAVTWCLYGVEYNIRDKDKALPMVNLATFDEMEEGAFSEVVVEIQMRRKKSERLIFRRELIVKKRNGRPIVVPDYGSDAPGGSKFTLIRQIGKNMVPVTDPQYIVNTLLPQSIEEYFFFDGERLDAYFKGESRIEVMKAVYKISQIGLLERLIEHLGNRKMAFTKKAKKISPQIEEIRGELEIYQKSLERVSEELDRLRSDRNAAEREFEKYSDRLRRSSNVNVRQLEEERLELEGEIDELDDRISDLRKDKLQLLIESAPAIFLNAPLTKLSKLIEERDESGKIPPEYRKSFINRLLREEKCICDTDLRKNKEAKKKLESLLSEYDEVSELSNLLIRMQGHINLLQRTAGKFDQLRIGRIRTMRDYEKQREDRSKRLKRIKEQIESIDVDKIMHWETERQRWSRKKEELNVTIGAKNEHLRGYKKRIDGLEKELDEELKKIERGKELARIREFCRKAENAAETIKEEIMHDIKNSIEKKTREQFLSLIWKASDYRDLKIDDKYNVSVVHQSGFEGLGTLSAGEGIVLAMAFMAALNSESGFDAPIIIDTPLGRIAGEPRKRIAANLPNYLPDEQVTMLVTDTEYTEDVRELLSKRVGKTFKIDFTETGAGGIAEVVPVE